jgi:hypothetical protein
MCFPNDDYDWAAEVQVDEYLVADKPIKCLECFRTISVGDRFRQTYQQEDETCRNHPASDHYDGPEADSDECAPGCEHDYGETYTHRMCETCDQLIEAIHQHEIDEGCSEIESRPCFGELGDAMFEGPRAAYLAKAETMFPGITSRLPSRWVSYLADE